ncbi:MAG: exported protein of unknown function [Modestobacter sp.]|nr:exported protein of unknown function [Modestobacter sp.]
MSQPTQGPHFSGPPGQGGGWQQPPAPAYGDQPTQVGGFAVPGQQPYGAPAPGFPAWGSPGGPGGPGGPGWPGNPQGPGGPGGSGSGAKKGLLIGGTAALVLLVVLGVVLTLTLGGGDEPVASDRTVDSSSAPATSEDFLATLPADFIDCRQTETEGDGDTMAAGCGAGGQVGCAILDDGSVIVTWTDEEYLIEGFVTGPGSTQAELSALFSWWHQNAFSLG